VAGLLSVGAPAWKCAARDRWIGWDLRHQYDRLHLIANNTRFLILPEHHSPNLASRILWLCERRLPQEWTERFGHPWWLLETFVDPRLSPDTRRLQRHRADAQAGVRAPLSSPRQSALVATLT
jgi:hypothetical protein